MNPILFATLETIRRRKRQCPVCGHRQYVPPEKSRSPVLCTVCGAHIPPSAAGRRKAGGSSQSSGETSKKSR